MTAGVYRVHMASIRERPRKDGSVTWAVLWREAEDGKQTSRTFTDEREARLLKDFLDANGNSFALAAQAAVRLRSQAPTVATVVEEHIEGLTGVSAGTRLKYQRITARHITPHLGSWPVDTLARHDVARWLNGLELSAKSKRNVHAILSASLAEAVDRKLIEANPAKGIKMPAAGETSLDNAIALDVELTARDKHVVRAVVEALRSTEEMTGHGHAAPITRAGESPATLAQDEVDDRFRAIRNRTVHGSLPEASTSPREAGKGHIGMDEFSARRREREEQETPGQEEIPMPDEALMAAYSEPQESILARERQDADAEGPQD